MEGRSSARGGDRGHLDHHRQLLLRRPAAAAWSYASAGGVSWPVQRSPPLSSSYTCGYCKREFRSAQALGGHMNVHRRERARIRHYYCSSYSAAPAPAAVHRDSRVPNLNFSPPQHCPAGDYGNGASTAGVPAVYSFFSTAAAAEAAKAALVVDLELGVGGGAGGLDLELRLGCS